MKDKKIQIFSDGPSFWSFETKQEAIHFAMGCEELFNINCEILKTAPIKKYARTRPFFALFKDGVDDIGSEYGRSISLYYSGFDAALASLKGLNPYQNNPKIRKNY